MPGRSSRNFCRRGIIQNEAKAVEAERVTWLPADSAFNASADLRMCDRPSVTSARKAVAGLRQQHLAMASSEELDAELILQAADRVGDGGLRHAEFPASPP